MQVSFRLSTQASSSCSSSARAFMSAAHDKLVIFLLHVLTFPSCSSRASDMKGSRKMLKRVDGEDSVALLLTVVLNQFPCCHSPELHLYPCCRAAQRVKLDLHCYCTSTWWPVRLHAILYHTINTAFTILLKQVYGPTARKKHTYVLLF